MTPPQCDCTVYGSHALGHHYLMLIGPSDTYRRFCDSDCVVQQLRADHARAAREAAAGLEAL